MQKVTVDDWVLHSQTKQYTSSQGRKWSYNSQFNHKIQMEEKQATGREYTKVLQVILSINRAETLSISYSRAIL